MTLLDHHKKLKNKTNKIGKCSVPMWRMGMPAGFCDEPAFGPQEKSQRRYGEYGQGYDKNGNWCSGGIWHNGYCGGLACYNHGGPKN